MEKSFVIAVALGVAVAVSLLVLVAIIIYQRWRDKDGVKPQDTANARLITVTPECRQQLVEAYRKYMKKSKRNK